MVTIKEHQIKGWRSDSYLPDKAVTIPRERLHRALSEYQRRFKPFCEKLDSLPTTDAEVIAIMPKLCGWESCNVTTSYFPRGCEWAVQGEFVVTTSSFTSQTILHAFYGWLYNQLQDELRYERRFGSRE